MFESLENIREVPVVLDKISLLWRIEVLKMLKVNDIVRSRKQNGIVVPYLIKEINGDKAKCINLIDTYTYTIPLDDLYLWIFE